jgi:hypothetical protein
MVRESVIRDVLFRCHFQLLVFAQVRLSALISNALFSHSKFPSYHTTQTAHACKSTKMSHANHKWIWCDDHAKVTTWFSSLPDHHDYSISYASFINTANRSWEISVDKSPTAKKLQPLDRLIVDCLQEKPIPANMLIEALRTYNKFIGGTKGALKDTGLIKFGSVAPGKIVLRFLA